MLPFLQSYQSYVLNLSFEIAIKSMESFHFPGNNDNIVAGCRNAMGPFTLPGHFLFGTATVLCKLETGITTGTGFVRRIVWRLTFILFFYNMNTC